MRGDVDAVNDIAYRGIGVRSIVDEGPEDGVKKAPPRAERAIDIDMVDGSGGEGVVQL